MSDSKILITGSEGLVGSRFVEISEHRSKLYSPRLVEFDITNKDEVRAVLESYNLSTIINFAAYTDVTGAESERGDKGGNVWKINVLGPSILAEAVALAGKKVQFIQISTDMVFSGGSEDPGPYEELHPLEDKLENLTWYGYTKAKGEEEVKRTLKENVTILRLIYPVRADYKDKLDYIRRPLALFDSGKIYPLFDNQQMSISFIDEIVLTLDQLISRGLTGVFHASSRDTTNPYELIKHILEKTGRDSSVLKSVSLEDFIKSSNSPSFRYPKFGGLSVDQTEKKLGMKFSSWREIVDKLIEQGLGKK